MLEKAIKVAKTAHKDQLDKGGHDYIEHPLRVMESMKTEDEKIVAVLHDVVEDTFITIRDLVVMGFSDIVITSVRYMTRLEGQTWKSYIEGVMSNKIATRVKIADLRDNLDLTRLRGIKDLNINSLNMYITTYHKLVKYERENR